MNKISLKRFSTFKGFTLIELLIVIAILGVLAAAALAILDPVDKIRAGNDSKVISDITSIAKAAEAYAVANDGAYPTALSTAAFGSELRGVPTEPGGYTAYAWSGGGNSAFTVSGQLKSKKYTATPHFKYTSATGKSCAAAAVTGDC